MTYFSSAGEPNSLPTFSLCKYATLDYLPKSTFLCPNRCLTFQTNPKTLINTHADAKTLVFFNPPASPAPIAEMAPPKQKQEERQPPSFRMGPSLPPQVTGSLIGSFTCTVTALRLLRTSTNKSPPSTRPRIVLTWWGLPPSTNSPEVAQALTFEPSVQSLGHTVYPAVPNNSITVFPILGGVDGLDRYLNDMNHLSISLRCDSPDGEPIVVGEGRFRVDISEGLGGKSSNNIYQIVDARGEAIAELKCR